MNAALLIFLRSVTSKPSLIKNEITAIRKDKYSNYTELPTSEPQTYDRYIEIELGASKGQKMLDYANATYTDKTGSYQLFTHNCVQVAGQILEAGGVNFGGPPPYNNVPNTAFKWGMLKAIFNDWEIKNISKNPIHLY